MCIVGDCIVVYAINFAIIQEGRVLKRILTIFKERTTVNRYSKRWPYLVFIRRLSPYLRFSVNIASFDIWDGFFLLIEKDTNTSWILKTSTIFPIYKNAIHQIPDRKEKTSWIIYERTSLLNTTIIHLIPIPHFFLCSLARSCSLLIVIRSWYVRCNQKIWTSKF